MPRFFRPGYTPEDFSNDAFPEFFDYSQIYNSDRALCGVNNNGSVTVGKAPPRREGIPSFCGVCTNVTRDAEYVLAHELVHVALKVTFPGPQNENELHPEEIAAHAITRCLYDNLQV